MSEIAHLLTHSRARATQNGPVVDGDAEGQRDRVVRLDHQRGRQSSISRRTFSLSLVLRALMRQRDADSRCAQGFSLKIEVECQNLDDAVEAIKAGADVVMLDNMPPAALDAAARDLRTIVQPSLDTPTNFLIEASGGITLETLGEYMSDWVDVISLGSLTQGVPHVDLSLKIQASE